MLFFAINEQELYGLQAHAINKSTDGGKTWTRILETTDSALYSESMFSKLYFFNERKGFVETYKEGELLMTADGGKSWETIKTGITENTEDIFLINENEGFITAEYDNTLYATKDGGRTWKSAGKGVPSYYLNKMYFFPDGYGILTSRNWITLFTKDFGLHTEVFLNGNGDGDGPVGTFSPIDNETLIFACPSELYKIHINRNDPISIPNKYDLQMEGFWDVEYLYIHDTGNSEENKTYHQWRGTMLFEVDSTATVIHDPENVLFPGREFQELLKWYKIGSDSIALFSQNTNWTDEMKYEIIEVSSSYLKIQGFDDYYDLWTLTLRRKK